MGHALGNWGVAFLGAPMANKFYNKQTTTSLKPGGPSKNGGDGTRSVKINMQCPEYPKSMGGKVGSFHGLKGAEVCPIYPEQEGLN